MTVYRAAVIGLGRIASTIDEEIEKYEGHPLPFSHIACYTDVPEIQLVGMADTWVEQRAAVKQRWEFDTIHDDYKTMLKDTKPEIVSVCTSTRQRPEVVVEIAEGDYGVKAIWAEKPLSISLAEADRMITACQEANIVLAVNCGRRWRDGFRQAVAMIKDGLIGNLIHVQAMTNCGISHNGSHLLTTMTMFAGSRVNWVTGEADVNPDSPDDDFQAAGQVGFTNGARGYFWTFSNGPNEWSFDITGTEGMLRLIEDGHAAEHWVLNEPPAGIRTRVPARRILPPPLRQCSPGINAIYDIIRCIESGGTPNCSGEDAREALEIAVATRESHRLNGCRVKLPMSDRSQRIIPRDVLMGDTPRAVAGTIASQRAWQSMTRTNR